ncbi:hypothetical protein WCD74_00810 [Actinomycetospora sp. OC33-EN08]|uniref:Alpha/beta hydrolase n=1 Tax=Actinomycetospora aurantiaca TaxID=3129233 RepID=A0ABU8MG25_9PSEU
MMRVVCLPGTVCSLMVFAPPAELVPGVEAVSCGHTPVYEAPEVVAEAIASVRERGS